MARNMRGVFFEKGSERERYSPVYAETFSLGCQGRGLF